MKLRDAVTQYLPTGNATRGHDEGNPRKFYVGIDTMISDLRQRRPRDGPMQCGNQPANIRVISSSLPASRVAFPVESDNPRSGGYPVMDLI